MPDPSTPQTETQAGPPPPDLLAAIQGHELWLTTGGKKGRPFHFEGRGPWPYDFHGRDLSRADLSERDFTGANVHGTRFTDATLRGARLRHARGVSDEQFAGADLGSAELPDGTTFESLAVVNNLVERADRLTTVLLLTCLSVVAICVATPARDLFAERTSLSIPGLSVNVSVRLFFIAIPLLLLGLQLSVCFLISTLYRALSDLPARFPSGRSLDRQVSGSFPNLCFLLPRHLRRLDPREESLRRELVSTLFIWWLVPLTLAVVWLRYLPRHDPPLIVMHFLALGAAGWMSVWSHDSCVRRLRHQYPAERLRVRRVLGLGGDWRDRAAVAAYALVGLTLLPMAGGSLTAVRSPVAPAPYPAVMESWGEWLGTALLGEDDGSDQLPAGRRVREAVSHLRWQWAAASLAGADLDSVDLSHQNLRRAQLGGASLAKANLEHAELQGARLVGAVLTRANLKDARLQRAVLWEARLDSARMREARLQHAHLGSADLRGAGLQGARLMYAKLQGARLDGAILCGADLTGAAVTADQLERTFGHELAIVDPGVRAQLRARQRRAAAPREERDSVPGVVPGADGGSAASGIPGFLWAANGGSAADAEREREQFRAWRDAWGSIRHLDPRAAPSPERIRAVIEAAVLTMGDRTQLRKERLTRLIDGHLTPTGPRPGGDSLAIVQMYAKLYGDVRDKARNHCVDTSSEGRPGS